MGTGTYVIAEQTVADPILGINVGDKYAKCTSAGTASFQSEQAYGTWEFDFKVGSASSDLRFYFISKEYGGLENSYRFRVISNQALQLSRVLNGAGAQKFSTATSYISVGVKYSIKITRELDGKFTLYIKGGLFGNTYTLVDVTGGSGTNPVTDNTYTNSKYTVVDNDTNDQISNFKYTKGIVQ